MHDMFPHLLSPLRVGNHILKNRMICPPSKPHFIQGPENYPSNIIDHYAQRARNGAALITCDGTHLDGDMGPHMMGWDGTNANVQHYMAQMADAVHFYGSLANGVIMAFAPRGYDVSEGVPTHYVVGDGSKPRYDCKEMTLEMIQEFIDTCVKLAKVQQEAGFDGVYIHMAYRGVIPGRFLSPLTNKRTDQFGGSFENRIRFPLTLCQEIKKACGKDFLIEASISGHDPDPAGWTLEDSCNFAKAAKGCIDILQLRAPNIDPNHPTGFSLDPTPWLYMAETVKASNPEIVISTVAGYMDPVENEKIIAEGKADLISMARAFVSNPEYGKLVYEGRPQDIVPCIRCNKCHRSSDSDPWMSVCSVNPRWAMDHRIDKLIVKPERSRRVGIVGGGVAGMEAALECAKRGHQVTLYEKSGKLGGLLNHADDVDFKWPLRNFKNFMVRKVGENPAITVTLNTAATVEQLNADGNEVVIAAVGSEPISVPIPGLDGPQVMNAVEVYGREDELAHDVVVIGGGDIGTETGLHLARTGHKVTVIEMKDKLAPESYRVHYYSMFMDACDEEPNFSSLLECKVTGVTEDSVSYTDKNGGSHTIPAGSVVVAAGMRAKLDEAYSFASAGKQFFVVGDCIKAGSVQKCMRTAYDIANSI